jgi:hypothetical protein
MLIETPLYLQKDFQLLSVFHLFLNFNLFHIIISSYSSLIFLTSSFFYHNIIIKSLNIYKFLFLLFITLFFVIKSFLFSAFLNTM